MFSPVIDKVCPVVVRNGRKGLEILAFEHPCGDFQLVKGTVEAGEKLDQAARRELEEEAGLRARTISPPLSVFDQLVPSSDGTGEEWQRWHVLLAEPERPPKETWSHDARGSEEEQGLVFRFFWQPSSGDLGNYHPIFHKVIALIQNLV